VCADGTAVTTPAEIATAITGGKELIGIKNMGNSSMTKSTTEHTVIDKNDVAYSAGTISVAPIDFSVLFNAKDTAGQDDLKTIFLNNEKRVFIRKLTDDGVVSPTYETWTGFVTKNDKMYEQGSAVMYETTIQPTTLIAEIAATDV